MQIHQMIKEKIKEHKNKIELFQWAVISGISSYVYTEYIMNIRQKIKPTRKLLVPDIKFVINLLNPESKFMQRLSEHLIDSMINNNLFIEYKDAPELVMFNDDNIEIMKTIFDLYIIPNISRRIPEAMINKFGLNDPSNQDIIQNPDSVIFDEISRDYIFEYLVEEITLQFISMLPTVKKTVKVPEDHTKIFLEKDEIIIIEHEKALCPIYINSNMIDNESPMMNKLKFVSSTMIEEFTDGKIDNYMIQTNVFNEVSIIKLDGLSTDKISE